VKAPDPDDSTWEYSTNRRGFLSLSTLSILGLGLSHTLRTSNSLGGLTERPESIVEVADICCPQALLSVGQNEDRPLEVAVRRVRAKYSNVIYSPALFDDEEC
jgi:hypothetical protein